MNGDEYSGPILNEFNPSWMEDGGGITGEQNYPDFSDNLQWDTNAWSRVQDDQDVFGSAGCLSQAGSPPEMGTVVLGSVDGVCQWIDTTTCS